MKRAEIVRLLRAAGCVLLREGRKHSVYVQAVSGRISTVPRHREIHDNLARKILKDLGVKP